MGKVTSNSRPSSPNHRLDTHRQPRCRATSLSVPSRSLQRHRSRTALCLSGFAFAQATPSATTLSQALAQDPHRYLSVSPYTEFPPASDTSSHKFSPYRQRACANISHDACRPAKDRKDMEMAVTTMTAGY